VFKSTDAGATWDALDNTGLMNTFVAALAIDPITPDTLYAGTYGGAVFKSTDAGATWNAAGMGVVGRFVTSLVIDPFVPNTLYAGAFYDRCAGKGGCFGGGVFKSTDGGATWGALNKGFASPAVTALAIDPSTPATLYAVANRYLHKSTDGAETWNWLDALDAVSGLAIDPLAPGTLYAGTRYGVFKSTDAGVTWNALNTGLTNRRVQSLAIDPLVPSRLYAGTEGGGVFSIEQVAACIGDCNMDGAVRVNELVTLMNIGLGEAPASMCPSGVPDGAAVDIGWIIAAVGNGLHGCGNGS
jgi:photosystem II stability/assembly factor-like uncharacterized protein